ncbi:MAG: TonB family protein [Candidatus Binataceae bacterium]
MPAALLVSIIFHSALIAILAMVLTVHRWRNPGVTYIYLLRPAPAGDRTSLAPAKAAPPAKPKVFTAPPRSKPTRIRRKPQPTLASKATAPPAPAQSPHDTRAASSGDATTAPRSATGGPGSAAGTYDSGSGQLFADQVDQPPAVIFDPLPDYPEEARRRGLEGEVVLRIIVDQAGAVEPDIQIIKSIPVLNSVAIEAIRKWRFSPGRDRFGKPVRVLLEVPLRFTLRSSD